MTAATSQRHRVRQHRQVSKVRFFRSDFSERRKTVRKSKNKPKNSRNADYSTAIRLSSAESPGLRKTWMRITAQIKRRNDRKYRQRHKIRKANGKCIWRMCLPDDRPVWKSTEAGGNPKVQKLKNSKNRKLCSERSKIIRKPAASVLRPEIRRNNSPKMIKNTHKTPILFNIK
jgi:hypothetical protein